MIGGRIGRLVVESESSKKYHYNCICDCGNVTVVASSDLRRWHTKSCGCLSKQATNYKHGMYGTRFYRIHKSMLARCRPNAINHEIYHDRGIKVCEHWLKFENFLEDMFSTYKEGLTLDRIDVDGNYEPANCRWVTSSTNGKNKRVKAEFQSDLDYVIYNRHDNKWLFTRRFKTKEEAEKFAILTRSF